VLVRPFSLLTTALIAISPDAGNWKEYPQPPLGFVVEFPADPVASSGCYQTVLVPSATANIFSVREDRAIYVATVVDIPAHSEEGAILLGEAESLLVQLGDVTSISISRADGDPVVYGRLIMMDCRAGRTPDLTSEMADTSRAWFRQIAGVEFGDLSRLTANLFFSDGRLYLIQAIHLPSAEDSAAALRFTNSVHFLTANSSRERSPS
jgi:hypothetical protein